MTTKYNADLLHWIFGPCSKSREYANDNTYIEKCCVRPGNHTLTCLNTKQPYGWKKGTIEINGHEYCGDFIGFKAMRRVTIKGNYSRVSAFGISIGMVYKTSLPR